MANNCGLDFSPGTSYRISKLYSITAGGEIALDKADFLIPLRDRGSGAPAYLDQFGCFGSLTLSTDAAHDLDTDMILPALLKRILIRDPQERINVAGGCFGAAIERERPGWAFSSVAVVAKGASGTTIDFWLPFPVGLGLVPGDLQDQYDLMWSLTDLIEGEVKLTLGSMAVGNLANPATVTSGGLYFYASTLERTASPGPRASGPMRPMRYMLKDHPLTSTSADTMPLSSRALIRWVGLYIGDVAFGAGDSPQRFTSGRTYTSSVGKYDSIPDRALALLMAGLDSPIADRVYWPGSVQPLLRAPASDVTDHTVADSFDFRADAPPVSVANNVPLTVVAWFGDRPNEDPACSKMMIQGPTGATVTSAGLLAMSPTFAASVAAKLPAFPSSAAPTEDQRRVNPAPVNPLLSVA